MDISKRVLEITDGLKADMLEFCKQIVETPSYSGQEEAVAKLFVNKLNELGYDEVYTDDWGNVIGLIKGSKPGPTIMYNGHMDVVSEGDPASWEGYDPFKAVVDECMMKSTFSDEEEKTLVIHGRGTGDLKCNLASQVYAGAALIKLREEGYELSGTFLLTAVALEEYGEMMGTIKMCEEFLPKKNIEPDAMVCCEPSGLKVILGHRGRMEIRVTVFGRSCHGSSPWLGINAVEKSAKLIEKVSEMMANKTESDPYLGKPGIALTMYDCQPNELCIVPDKCTIVYDRRLVPGETTDSAIKEIQDIVDEISKEDPEFKATVEINKNLREAYTGKSDWIESAKEVWIIDREHPFVKACAKGLEDIGEPIVYDYWAFSTDIPMLAARMHKPVIGYGAGQEHLIHTPQEKVRIDYIDRSLAANVMMYLSASVLPMEDFKA